MQYHFRANVIRHRRRAAPMHPRFNFHPIKVSPMNRHQKWTYRHPAMARAQTFRSSNRAGTAPHRKRSTDHRKNENQGPRVLKISTSLCMPSKPQPMNESHKLHNQPIAQNLDFQPSFKNAKPTRPLKNLSGPLHCTTQRRARKSGGWQGWDALSVHLKAPPVLRTTMELAAPVTRYWFTPISGLSAI